MLAPRSGRLCCWGLVSAGSGVRYGSWHEPDVGRVHGTDVVCPGALNSISYDRKETTG
jgi:hypothetical protein